VKEFDQMEKKCQRRPIATPPAISPGDLISCPTFELPFFSLQAGVILETRVKTVLIDPRENYRHRERPLTKVVQVEEGLAQPVIDIMTHDS
jgi:hypothetical protein